MTAKKTTHPQHLEPGKEAPKGKKSEPEPENPAPKQDPFPKLGGDEPINPPYVQPGDEHLDRE